MAHWTDNQGRSTLADILVNLMLIRVIVPVCVWVVILYIALWIARGSNPGWWR